MKLATRILLAVFLIIGAGFFYLTSDILSNVRVRYLEGVEETLVDQSRILSSFISYDMEKGDFSADELHEVFDRTYENSFVSNIYHITKTTVDMRIYLTDNRGKILFDSSKRAVPGTDYSSWRDVHLTLQGKYGARSSRDNPYSKESTVLYVAAPVMVNGKISGVLTVAKPTTNINNFLVLAKSQIKNKSLIIAGLVTLFSICAIAIITKPIKHLTRYANDVSQGKQAEFPRLDKSEIGDMGRAFHNMREALENRQYVEKYVQTLTHEIKSPVSAIKGAAELLGEEMPKKQRDRFLENIRTESDRIKKLVERMLELAALENMKSLEKHEVVVFEELIRDAIKSIRPVFEEKQLRLMVEYDDQSFIKADPFLVRQAVLNLIQNSVDFSMPGDTILISLKQNAGKMRLTIRDQGPGIPEYAGEKVFERFFSLQRPDNGIKSTGLGLNFVKEIAALHKGSICLENVHEGGVCATFSIPVNTHTP